MHPNLPLSLQCRVHFKTLFSSFVLIHFPSLCSLLSTESSTLPRLCPKLPLPSLSPVRTVGVCLSPPFLSETDDQACKNTRAEKDVKLAVYKLFYPWCLILCVWLSWPLTHVALLVNNSIYLYGGQFLCFVFLCVSLFIFPFLWASGVWWKKIIIKSHPFLGGGCLFVCLWLQRCGE